MNAEVLESQEKWEDAAKEYRAILGKNPRLPGIPLPTGPFDTLCTEESDYPWKMPRESLGRVENQPVGNLNRIRVGRAGLPKHMNWRKPLLICLELSSSTPDLLTPIWNSVVP